MRYKSLAYELTSFREIESLLEKVRNETKHCDEAAQHSSDDVEIRKHSSRHGGPGFAALDVSIYTVLTLQSTLKLELSMLDSSFMGRVVIAP